jgi:hypothetical protein
MTNEEALELFEFAIEQGDTAVANEMAAFITGTPLPQQQQQQPQRPELSGRDTVLGGLESFGQGATLGAQDEIGGFVGAAIEAVFGDPFEEYYKQAGIEEQSFSEKRAD